MKTNLFLNLAFISLLMFAPIKAYPIVVASFEDNETGRVLNRRIAQKNEEIQPLDSIQRIYLQTDEDIQAYRDYESVIAQIPLIDTEDYSIVNSIPITNYNEFLQSIIDIDCEKEVLANVRGYDIMGLTIGDVTTKPVVFLFNQHGNEYRGVHTLREFVKHLLTSQDPQTLYLRENVAFYIVPTVGAWNYANNSYLLPDSVNSNRTWDRNWEKSSYTDKGTGGPWSVPEVQPLRDKIIELKPFLIIDIHSSYEPGLDITNVGWTPLLMAVHDSMKEFAISPAKYWITGFRKHPNSTGWGQVQIARDGKPAVTTTFETDHLQTDFPRITKYGINMLHRLVYMVTLNRNSIDPSGKFISTMVANFEDDGSDRMIENRIVDCSSSFDSLASKIEIVDRPTSITGDNSSNKVLKVYDINRNGQIILNLKHSQWSSLAVWNRIYLTDYKIFTYNTLTFKYARTGSVSKNGTFQVSLEGRSIQYNGMEFTTTNDNHWHTVKFRINEDNANPAVNFVALLTHLGWGTPAGDLQIYLDDIQLSYEEEEESVTTNMLDNTVKVLADFSLKGRTLQMQHFPTGSHYAVYDMQGRKLHGSLCSTDEEYEFPTGGIYAISLYDEQTKKITVHKVAIQ